MNTTPIVAFEDVRAVLARFQEGYTRRRIEEIDSFLELFAPEAGIELVGTGGIEPGNDEWCLSRKSIRQLIEDDWNYWGDVRLDVDNARIHVEGTVAWLSCAGTVKRQVNSTQTYQNFLDYMQSGMNNDQNLTPQQKVYRLVQEGSNILFQTQKGPVYIWPFRFTAVLVRRGPNWRFHQIQFSFPTTHFPDVRLTENNNLES